MTDKLSDLNNPPQITVVLLGVVLFLFGVTCGVLSYLLTSWPWALVLFTGLSVIVLLVFWFREYFKRPTRVGFEKEGIRLFFRYTRPRLLRWDEIECLRLSPGKKNGRLKDFTRGGALDFRNETFSYFLTYEIAEAIRLGYLEKLGRPPPIEKY
jgi:hypothetical protein